MLKLPLFVMLAICSVGYGQKQEGIKAARAWFEPTEAKPGQVVTLNLEVELFDGWFTYPFTQPDKGARFQTNKITFPTVEQLLFVRTMIDPKGGTVKEEGEISILQFPTKAVFQRKVVVHPKAKPGEVTVELKASLLACDKNNCLPPKRMVLPAKLKVLDTPAVAVDPEYEAEVKKLLMK
ncbi:MAG: hypothetical protein R3B84_11920 [Zavarzinella sp.]